MANIYGNTEIYKDNDVVTETEVAKILEFCEIYGRYNDTANSLVAFDLKCDDDTAEKIVDTLNEMAENNGEDGLWYIGDETEEYVYVN